MKTREDKTREFRKHGGEKKFSGSDFRYRRPYPKAHQSIASGLDEAETGTAPVHQVTSADLVSAIAVLGKDLVTARIAYYYDDGSFDIEAVNDTNLYLRLA